MKSWITILLLCTTVKGYLIAVSPASYMPVKICEKCQESFLDGREYRCRLFYNMDVVRGNRIFYPCTVSRRHESYCGVQAKYFFLRRDMFNTTDVVLQDSGESKETK